MEDLSQRFRPMGVGDIMDTVFKLYSKNFLTLFVLSAVLYLPFSTIMGLAQKALLPSEFSSAFYGRSSEAPETLAAEDFEILIVWVVVAVISAFLFQAIILPLIQGGLTRTISESFLGRKVGAGQALSFALRKALPLIFTAILYGLAVLLAGVIAGLVSVLGFMVSDVLGVLALILLVLPAILACAIYLILYNQVVVIEGKGYVAALSRSARLVSGHFWRMLGLGILFVILAGIMEMIGALPSTLVAFFMPSGGSVLFATIWNALIRALVTPITLIGLTLVYFDLRMRKEGFDLEIMAQNIGASEGALEGGPANG